MARVPELGSGAADTEITLFLNDVKNLARGSIASSDDPRVIAAAERYRRLRGGALAAAALQFSRAGSHALQSLGERNREYAERHFDQRRILTEQEQFLLQRIG